MTTDPTRAQADEALRKIGELALLAYGVRMQCGGDGLDDDGPTMQALWSYCEDALRQRLAADTQPLEAKGWRTIDSAPRDGTRVQLWVVNAYLHAHVKTGFVGRNGTVYSIFDDGDAGGHLVEEFATHWQPLPPPPAQSEVAIEAKPR